MFEALNYTPHDVVIYAEDGETVLHVFPSVGNARASADQRQVSEYALPDLKRLPIMSRPKYGIIDWDDKSTGRRGEPDLELNVLVSIVAADPACSEREDLGVYVPDTGPDSAVRSTQGQILGVKRLIRWQPSRSPWQWTIKRLVDQGATVGGWDAPFTALIAIGSNPTGEPCDVLVFGGSETKQEAVEIGETWAPKVRDAMLRSSCEEAEYSHILIKGSGISNVQRVEIPRWRDIGDPSPQDRIDMANGPGLFNPSHPFERGLS